MEVLNMKKIYLLTIEYDTETDTVEYIKEEVVDDSAVYEYGDFILDDYFDEESLELISEGYILGIS
tara:strand:+ start:783 stop:980 length:198 start_codon:yes stop_codon:yes gene_type:complete